MSQSIPNPSLPLPKLIKRDVIYDKFVKIQIDQLAYQNGYIQDYFTLVTKSDAVMVVGITEEGKFLINQEYRHAAGQILYCFPGGYLEKDEDPLIGGKRELLEETGYSSDYFELIGKAYPFPGISSQCLYYIRARNIKKIADPQQEPSELIITDLYSEEDLLEIANKSENLDGILGTALFFHFLHK